MTTFVVGDIQGCYAEFRELLSVSGFRASSDTLWLVGDLVNRGPNNIDTLRYIMSLERTVTVLGNHDLHFLAIACGHHKQSRSDTLDDLLEAPELDDIIAWFRKRPLLHVDQANDIVMVHAGLPPIWTVDKAIALANEVEATLRSDQFDDFLGAMYGDQPDTWHESLTGVDRLRIITNYLTRIRYCTQAGKLELTAKTDIKPEGFDPWFSFPRPDTFRIIFGHWAALNGVTANSLAVALDTGCVWGRELTALRLEDGKRFSVTSHLP